MKKNKMRCTWRELLAAIIVSFGGLLFGYNTAVISGALAFLQRDFSLNVFDQGMIVSVVLIGALLGAAVGGMLADRTGRRYSLFITAVLYMLGIIIMMSSHVFSILLIGRFVVGIGVGLSSVVVPLYIAEISDPKHRGALVSFNQLAITIGILLAYAVGLIFAENGEWRPMFAYGIIPTIVFFLGLFFIPESPSWLASIGRNKKAQEILKKMHPLSKSEEVIIETKKSTPKKMVSWKHLFDKGVKQAFFVGIGLSVFQQITGINVVIYYAPTIFDHAGFQTHFASMLATLGVGAINVIMTVVALWLIDVIGRRPLLLIGLTGMVASLAVLGVTFIFHTAGVSIITVISLMTYISFFAISLGPVAWLIISEIFPMGIRGRAMGISIFANWVSNYVVSLTFLYIANSFGEGGAFWLYCGIGLIALWFVYKKVPETKGKTLEQIQEFWKKGMVRTKK